MQTLENFVFGKQELSQAQVLAIKILLRKILPDLRAQFETGTPPYHPSSDFHPSPVGYGVMARRVHEHLHGSATTD